jgi:predicted short-subunit dehydrogenase-like oxidoreductase (DUF2520 family)
LGCGRVGSTLGYLWSTQSVFLIQDVHNTSVASAVQGVQFIGEGRPVQHLGDMRPADVWMIAVPDGQIKNAARELSNTTIDSVFIASGAIIFHCSGALSSAELQPLADKGSRIASAHCILSFSAPSSAVSQFAGTPCALEGDLSAIKTLQPAFEAIGANCFDLAAQDKVLYHAAAVFATNFLPVLQVVAADLWLSTGMPKELITPLNASLLNKAVQNITAQGAANSLTGPAARGDAELVAMQGAAVAEWNADAGAAYAALSQLATRIAKDGTIQNPTQNKTTKDISNE